ncbi:hypothetical protein KAR91_06315 [Candidatus Pacearchaeota archaeon]|nr:hypothetical protein [Candidatus Pacearchaeota archaeon]
MNTMWRKIIVIVFIYVASSVLFLGKVQGKKPFLDSAGFEKISSLQKAPTGWHKTIPEKLKDYFEFIWDEEIAYQGEMSISIKISKDHPEDVKVNYSWYTDARNLEAEKEYELSCWIKGMDLENTAAVYVQCWDKSMSEMISFATTQKDHTIKGTFDWQKVETVFSVPKETYRIRVGAVMVAPDSNGGQVWFDELHIKEITETN